MTKQWILDPFESRNAMRFLKLLCVAIWIVTLTSIIRNPQMFILLEKSTWIIFDLTASLGLYFCADMYLPPKDLSQKIGEPSKREAVCIGAQP